VQRRLGQVTNHEQQPIGSRECARMLRQRQPRLGAGLVICNEDLTKRLRSDRHRHVFHRQTDQADKVQAVMERCNHLDQASQSTRFAGLDDASAPSSRQVTTEVCTGCLVPSTASQFVREHDGSSSAPPTHRSVFDVDETRRSHASKTMIASLLRSTSARSRTRCSICTPAKRAS
jgi:hypothetical protein